MTLLSRLLGARREPGPANEVELSPANVPEDWASGEDWRRWEAPLNVVKGESHRQAALQRVAGGGPRRGGYLLPVPATLRRDPANAYDRNAIAVDVGAEHVGFIARELAARVAPYMDRIGCRSMTVAGLIRGGSPTASYLSIHLWPRRRLGTGLDLVIEGAPQGGAWPPTSDEGVNYRERDQESHGFDGSVLLSDADAPRRGLLRGTKVCFTGASTCSIRGVRLTQKDVSELVVLAGLRYSNTLTKTVGLLVVTDEPNPTSAKLRKAVQMETRMMLERDFWEAIGVAVDGTAS